MIMGAKFTINNFSIVVPIFNEEEILLESCNRIFEICNETEIDFEMSTIKFQVPTENGN